MDNPSLDAGTIGLNTQQRESLQLVNGDVVHLQTYNLPTDPTFALHAMRLEFEVYGNESQKIILYVHFSGTYTVGFFLR